MAPEVFRGAPPDKRRDIYAVGATLYELTCGRRPFAARNDAELMGRISAGQFVPPRTIRTDLPPELDRLIVRAMAGDASERWDDAAQVARTLRDILDALDGRNPARLVAKAVRTLFGDERATVEPSLRTTSDSLTPVQRPQAEESEAGEAVRTPPSASPRRANAFATSPGARRTGWDDSVATGDLFTPMGSRPTESNAKTSTGDIFTSPGDRAGEERTPSVFALYGRSTPPRAESGSPLAPQSPAADVSVAEDDGTKHHALVHFERGLEFRRNGELIAALAEWELAAELDPENRTIATNVRILKQKME